MTTLNQASVQADPPKQMKQAEGYSLEKQQRFWGWVFLSPWILGFFIFTLIPMLASLVFSLTNFTLTRPEDISFIGLSNYVKLTTDPLVAVSLTATFRFAIISLPLAIILPVVLAALLNAPGLKWRRLFQTLFYMPYMVPVVSAVYIWGGVLNPQTGWLNRFLGLLGISGPDWLFSIDWIYVSLVIIGLWGIGNAMLITLATMQGVPTELYEAARVDGARAWGRFRNITLPLISPVIFYNLVLSVIGLFRYFEIPFILKEGSGDPGNATMFFNIHLYKTAFSFQDMGYGATLAWLLFIMAFAVTLILFLTARYWVYYPSGDTI